MIKEEGLQDAIDECVEAIDMDESNFTEWEIEFIDSIAEQFDRKKFLTEGQQVQLERIWLKI